MPNQGRYLYGLPARDHGPCCPPPQPGQYLLALFHRRLLRAHPTLKIRMHWEAALRASSPLAARILPFERPLPTNKAAGLEAGAKEFKAQWLAELSTSPRTTTSLSLTAAPFRSAGAPLREPEPPAMQPTHSASHHPHQPQRLPLPLPPCALPNCPLCLFLTSPTTSSPAHASNVRGSTLSGTWAWRACHSASY
ncbi:hypothetical protein B0H19DRAFT_1253988 [Mycena capillaripes]|nr:hypothetical protein B0H19DRAFT_1253988 [Mycena capillaripes]